MNEVVRQDSEVPCEMTRSDDTDEWRNVSAECLNERVGPAARQHHRVIVDSVEEVSPVEVCVEHRIVLGPSRLTSVIARDQPELHGPECRTPPNCLGFESLPECIGELAAIEEGVVAVMSQVEYVDKPATGGRRAAKGWQQVPEELEFVGHIGL